VGRGWSIAKGRYSVVWWALISATTVGVLVLAYRSDGYPISEVSFNDGGIWVTNNAGGADGVLGRFNKPIDQLDSALTSPGKAQAVYNVDVAQAGSSVVLIDRGRGQAYPVLVTVPKPDQGTAIALPAGAQLQVGGDAVAILDPKTGKLWAGAFETLSAIAPQYAPASSALGPGAAMSVGIDGTVYGVSTDHKIIVTYPAGGGRPHKRSFTGSFSSAKLQASVVGRSLVVIDAQTGVVAFPLAGTTSTIAPATRGTGALVLQQPGPAADTVLLADSGELLAMPLGGGAPAVLSRSGRGDPASPVRVQGCDYAAWAGAAPIFVRVCDGLPTSTQPIPTAGTAIASLVFRVNHDQVVLTDPTTGAIWEVNDKIKKVDNWNAVKPQQKKQSNDKRFKTHQAPRRSSKDRPPVARADKLGARLGSSTILPVLDNDFDPDGDVIAITQVTQQGSSNVHLNVVNNEQAIKLRVDGSSSGDIHFRYTIDDGRGKRATAQATVHIYSSAENSPPNLSPSSPKGQIKIAGGQTRTLPVLDDWRDKNGDSLVLSSVSSTQGTVSLSGGAITYTAPPAPGRQSVTYTVSDGQASSKRTLVFDVLASNAAAVAPTALADVTGTLVGTPVTIYPLANDLPGADPTNPQALLALGGGVVAPAGVSVRVDQGSGAVTLTAARADTYFLSYAASFGSARPTTGRIRLDVGAAEAARPPITMPDVALIHGQAPLVMDPIANDVDPQNALLVVQSAVVGNGAPVSVAVVQHHWLRIQGTEQQLALVNRNSGPVVIRYTVSDGLTSSAEGDVVVTQLPAVRADNAPVALPDTGIVRAGSSFETNVVSNDTDPEGERLRLVPGKLAVHAADRNRNVGSAWAVDGMVRYVAPVAAVVPAARRVTVDYQVKDTAQNVATGQLELTINPPDAKHDSPPTPVALSARVDAGQLVTLRVPTYGVDPDGDVAAFKGIATAPKLGRIVSTGPQSIVYQAYPSASGPDRFVYTVADPYGQLGQATVDIGVAPITAAQAPVAVDDSFDAAPGASLHADVLANDVTTEGDPVALSMAPGQAQIAAHVTGNRIVVRVPSAKAAPLHVKYTLDDGRGVPSSATLTVTPIAGYDNPPVARDDYVPPVAPGQQTVSLDVLANDDDPDTPKSQLRISTVSAGARVIAGGRMSIVLGIRPRLVAYQLSDGTKTARAFAHVPGTAQGGPALKGGIGAITVPSTGTKLIQISQYVTDPRGRVRLTTQDALQGTPVGKITVTTQGTSTLAVSASSGYVGPAAVTFEVTDGKTLGDPNGRRAILSLPLRVGPETPYLHCPSAPIPLTIGAAPSQFDVASMCQIWLDDPVKVKALTFGIGWRSGSSGLSLRTLGGGGRQFEVSAPPAAQAGTVAAVRILTHGVGQSATATISFRSVPARAAATSPISLSGLVVGRPVSVDAVTALQSPFGAAATPRIVSVAKAPGVVVSTSGTSLTITPRLSGIMSFTYRITDVAKRSDRAVQGLVTLQVQQVATKVQGPRGANNVAGRKSPSQAAKPKSTPKVVPKTPTTTTPAAPSKPGIPGTPYVSSVGSGQVVLTFAPPATTGTPIDQYRVADESGGTWSCPASPCTIANGLTNGTAYRFRVQAHAAQWGEWSPWSLPATPDELPGAVPTVSATVTDGQATVTWAAPANGGSALREYQVQISPAAGDASVKTLPASVQTVAWSGLTNGTGYTFQVRASNGAGWSTIWGGPSVAVTPFGKPGQMAAPSASGVDSADAHEKAIQVTWAAADGNGRPIASYSITAHSSVSGVGDPVQVGGSATTYTTSVPNDGASWTYTVAATNSGGLTSAASPASAPVAAHTHPDSMLAPTASDNSGGIGYDGAVKLTFPIPSANGSPITSVEWTASSGGTGTFAISGLAEGSSSTQTVTGLTNGSTYTFTVRACNADGCGGQSPASNGASPYGAPAAPAAAASASGQTITYSWSGGGGNGRPTARYEISVDGGPWEDVGANPGSQQRSYGYSETHSFQAHVVDGAGQASLASASASARTVDAPPPPPTISISKGGGYYNATTCTDPSCARVNISLSNFPANSNVTLCEDTDASRGGSHFYCTTQHIDGAGNATHNGDFYFGYPGHPYWVDASGVNSNTIVW
jgi:hypothetical protein